MGYNNPPRAMMVTPDAPVKAVKKAQIINPTIATPPGIQPKQASQNRKSLLGELDSAMRNPERVNKGIVKMVGVLAIRYISTTTAAPSISARYMARRAAMDMMIKRGVPIRARIKIKKAHKKPLKSPPLLRPGPIETKNEGQSKSGR